MNSTQKGSWSTATLYGVDHSPWVQGIRLALHYHQVPAPTTSVPLSLRWFLSRGAIFPVLRPAGQAPMADSFAMYRAMEAAGYPLGLAALSEGEVLENQAALESMFGRYALGRCGPGKRWAFIRAWSGMRERPSRVLGGIFRAFLSLYFFVLIELGRWVRKRRGQMVYDLGQFETDIQRWERMLQSRPWVTGDTLGALDFALLGHVQCMMSGLTDELAPILRRQQALMAWLKKMHRAFEGYEPLYTRRLFVPGYPVTDNDVRGSVVFWTAWLGWLVIWPLTVPILVYCLYARGKNPAHSGAVARRFRRRLRNQMHDQESSQG